MMKFEKDKITEFSPAIITAKVAGALRIMLLKDPEKCAYGALVGAFLYAIKSTLSAIPILGEILNSFSFWSYTIFGVLVTRCDILFKKTDLDQDVIKKLNTFDEIMNKSNFSDAEKRIYYREFVNRYCNSIYFSDKSNPVEIQNEKSVL